MSNSITDEIVENISILSKLELSCQEKEVAKKDIEDMVSFVDKMNEIDTSDVTPLLHGDSLNNVFREDIVSNNDDSCNLLKNAPSRNELYIKVPKTIQ